MMLIFLAYMDRLARMQQVEWRVGIDTGNRNRRPGAFGPEKGFRVRRSGF